MSRTYSLNLGSRWNERPSTPSDAVEQSIAADSLFHYTSLGSGATVRHLAALRLGPRLRRGTQNGMPLSFAPKSNFMHVINAEKRAIVAR